tara:strand:+ start:451 stop:558 length:108 start_codon:yes stop_codon:yes gene_type:complete
MARRKDDRLDALVDEIENDGGGQLVTVVMQLMKRR